jgi:hypothetical protein|tara:strand:+ start:629 stop:994 length:366 start_codon:yes stop_codon:yes gene_type:complete
MPDTKSMNFEELVEYRKGIGYNVYGVELSYGIVVDSAFYKDVTWECIEELADAFVYLGFEREKLLNRSSKSYSRRIESIQNRIRDCVTFINSYRESVKEKYPELLEDTLEDEIRSGTLREV